MSEATDRYEKAQQRLKKAEVERAAAETEFRAARDALLTEISNGESELTHRERDILRLIRFGRSNKEIGGELNITDRTVKFHVSNILAKLHVGSRYKL